MLLAGLPTCGCGQSVNGRRLQDELDSLREQNTHTKHTALMRGHFWASVFSSVSVVFLKEFQLSFYKWFSCLFTVHYKCIGCLFTNLVADFLQVYRLFFLQVYQRSFYKCISCPFTSISAFF